jgi:hypothetical protein
MQQQQMLHPLAYAAPKRPRLSKAQKVACEGSEGCASEGCASEPSSDAALVSWEGPSPAYGAAGASGFGQNAWASSWNASAHPPPLPPAIVPASMYPGMSSGMGAQMLAMQQHLRMVQHPQAIAKVPVPSPSSPSLPIPCIPGLPCPCHVSGVLTQRACVYVGQA